MTTPLTFSQFCSSSQCFGFTFQVQIVDNHVDFVHYYQFVRYAIYIAFVHEDVIEHHYTDYVNY